MNFRSKLLSLEELAGWRAARRAAGARVVATNGCFDLLHLGHVTYLEAARALGDALLVGVNGDASVRALKGAGRPLNSERDRALVLAALASVDAVYVFPELTALAFLDRVRPDIYAKEAITRWTPSTRRSGDLSRVMAAGWLCWAGVPGKSTTQLAHRLAAG
ncbi:MAG: adenylyltransferase/cytidyltransferase family protein [Verrucomicrobia bacterium]|nr:adenylyltransferase/cytidyltransferase family protein [Verrucomicrobiota bacterium]